MRIGLRERLAMWGLVGVAGVTAGCSLASKDKDISETDQSLTNNSAFSNPFGTADVFSSTGSIDTNNPFFQNLGSNIRRLKERLAQI